QGIWRLQIGCLMFCERTEQYQLAAQSNTTIHVVAAPPGSSPAQTASSVNVTMQLVWQVQIGCLFWCFETAQHQSATTQNTVMVIVSGEVVAPPPPDTTPAPTDTGAQQVPPAAHTGDSGTAAGGAGADTATLASTPPPMPATHVSRRAAILTAISTATTGTRRVAVS